MLLIEKEQFNDSLWHSEGWKVGKQGNESTVAILGALKFHMSRLSFRNERNA